ncbi:hypothetical protein SLEP1_g40787 [Rubroshorea leprosula]|uniref:Uncharacterized protein n=1 Tax=Rubroshorea leprosula TaxID=152421 RepID=A0AAV5L4Y7_9ROSI|nr:hypothetical protein SLEP1_g40787 [Rubroshorea leprosula]
MQNYIQRFAAICAAPCCCNFAATLQPLHPHFNNICSLACCTLLLPCFGAALPASFAARGVAWTSFHLLLLVQL